MARTPPSKGSLQLMTKAELAVLLGCSERHIRSLIYHRRIPFVKLGPAKNSAVRFRVSEIARWIEQNSTEVGEFPR